MQDDGKNRHKNETTETEYHHLETFGRTNPAASHLRTTLEPLALDLLELCSWSDHSVPPLPAFADPVRLQIRMAESGRLRLEARSVGQSGMDFPGGLDSRVKFC